MSTPPTIPIPKEPRHQRYADNILAGHTGQDSYRMAYLPSTPKLTKESADNGHKRLKKHPEVIAYLRAVRAASATATVASLQYKRELLFEIMDIPLMAIDPNDPKRKYGRLIKKFKRTNTESGETWEIEKHCPLKAIELDNKIAGDDPESNLMGELALALQSLPKPAVSKL